MRENLKNLRQTWAHILAEGEGGEDREEGSDEDDFEGELRWSLWGEEGEEVGEDRFEFFEVEREFREVVEEEEIWDDSDGGDFLRSATEMVFFLFFSFSILPLFLLTLSKQGL